jgi:type I restriction-modification system DNA methylase subunit
MNGLLELTHQCLGWPTRQDIMKPKGAGPAVIADLARRKIGTAISRQNVDVDVGVLAANPYSNRTEDPLAIICDFNSHISEEVLRETHRLAWSFSRSPMLITIEPSSIKVWTCWNRPLDEDEDVQKLSVVQLEKDTLKEPSFSEQAAKSLLWVELTSGNFFKKPEYSRYFRREQRADQLMLEDLRAIRKKLIDAELPEDICHDLLARVIFIEFLFQRKDRLGKSALNENVLSSLHEKGILSKVHDDLASILEDRGETYRFFQELNNRFNGDLFPGKGDTPDKREEEWKAEMDKVKVKHLKLLSRFVRGDMDIGTGQLCIWRKYAFDAIPLEFISSIYEEFVSGEKYDETTSVQTRKAVGIHYTPGHAVDLILDHVLPWNSKKWDIRILDPACGSGIFLVKAYQRLVHRWRKAKGKPGVGDLRRLLEGNLFGVDKDRNAVRVASFSLYLAMCDELEPRYVWRTANFPRLRDKRLMESDFFAEDKDGFRTSRDRGLYDLVIGNAPWGYATETEDGKRWARIWRWSIPNKNLGPLFLCKSAALTNAKGQIAMLEPAGTMLFNRHSTSTAFRKKLFSKFTVEKIINLSALRFGFFKAAVSPACIVIMRPVGPSEDPTVYICPKPRHTKEDDYHVVVEPSDRNLVYREEATRDRLVWTVLAWGGRRDLALIRKLHTKPFSTIAQLEKEGLLRTGNGFKRKSLLPKEYPESRYLPVLEDHEIWDRLPMVTDTRPFPPNTNPKFERFRNLEENFSLPLMIMKESWTVEAKRFKGVLVRAGNSRTNKLLFSQSFNGIRSLGMDGYDINTIALAINSIFAVYYFLLTGARMGNYRPTLLLSDIRDFPLPRSASITTEELAVMAEVTIDERVKEIYGLKEAEWVLVEDLFNYTLRDFQEGEKSPGHKPTIAAIEGFEKVDKEPILRAYCDYFTRVLRAGFGQDKHVSATIFRGESEIYIPVRLVAMHLDTPGKSFIRVEDINSSLLIERLKKLDAHFFEFLKSRNRYTEGSVFYQRVARVYDSMLIDGREVPTVFIVKPDQVRYWTRSMAMRDADEVAGDIMLWREESGSKRKR